MNADSPGRGGGTLSDALPRFPSPPRRPVPAYRLYGGGRPVQPPERGEVPEHADALESADTRPIERRRSRRAPAPDGEPDATALVDQSFGVRPDERAARPPLRRSGDTWGRAAAYNAFVDGLHTYAIWLLREHDAAVDALYTTFMIADRHSWQLRKSELTQPWLYGLLRYECLVRSVPGVTAPAPISGRLRPTDPAADPAGALAALERDLRRAELNSLEWPEAAGLAPTDREILELSVRHGLDSQSIGLVLGFGQPRPDAGPTAASPTAAGPDGIVTAATAARDTAAVGASRADFSLGGASAAFRALSRAWSELERTLAAYAVAAGPREHCVELAVLAGPQSGRPDPARRGPLADHVDRCTRCQHYLHAVAGAPSAPTALPLVPAPRALRAFVLDELADPAAAERAGAVPNRLAARAGQFHTDGFPLQHDHATVYQRAAMTASLPRPTSDADDSDSTDATARTDAGPDAVTDYNIDHDADADSAEVRPLRRRVRFDDPVFAAPAFPDADDDLPLGSVGHGHGLGAGPGHGHSFGAGLGADAGPGDAADVPADPTPQSTDSALGPGPDFVATASGRFATRLPANPPPVPGPLPRAGADLDPPSRPTSVLPPVPSLPPTAVLPPVRSAARSGIPAPLYSTSPLNSTSSGGRSPHTAPTGRRTGMPVKGAHSAQSVTRPSAGSAAVSASASSPSAPTLTSASRPDFGPEPPSPAAPAPVRARHRSRPVRQVVASTVTLGAVGAVAAASAALLGFISTSSSAGSQALDNGASGEIPAAPRTGVGALTLPVATRSGTPSHAAAPPGATNGPTGAPGSAGGAAAPGASGSAGGFYASINNRDSDPVSTTILLRNTGPAPITWSATAADSWLTLSQSSGTLAGGQSAVITATATAAAPVGAWTSSVTFAPGGITVVLHGQNGASPGGPGGSGGSPSGAPSTGGSASAAPTGGSSASPSPSSPASPAGSPTAAPSDPPSTGPSGQAGGDSPSAAPTPSAS